MIFWKKDIFFYSDYLWFLESVIVPLKNSVINFEILSAGVLLGVTLPGNKIYYVRLPLMILCCVGEWRDWNQLVINIRSSRIPLDP